MKPIYPLSKQLPQFNSIDPQTFPNTLQSVLKNNLSLINTLLEQSAPCTWETLIRPLEEAQNQVEQCWAGFSHLHAVQNTPEIRASYERSLPMLIEYETTLAQHEPLYQAIRSIPLQGLSSTKRKIIAEMLRDFELSGVNLPPTPKKRYQVIEEQLSELQTQFENNLVDAEASFELHIQDPKLLKGIPEHALKTAELKAKSKQLDGWSLGIDPPCYLAVMSYAQDRTLRETIYHAYVTRASDVGPDAGKFDNSEIMQDILTLRHEQAQLLGLPHYAALSLKTKMVKEVKEIETFIQDLLTRTQQQALNELQDLQHFAKTHFNIQELQPWDITYISEQLKSERFSFSEESLRPYFRESSVWSGIQMILKNLYNIQLREVNNVEVWHPHVRCFEVIDAAQQLKGYLYVDLFARPYKRTGAWMNSLQTQMKNADETIQVPIATLTCNFATPQHNQEATFLHDDVITLFHELGHCLHHLLTRITEYNASGIHGVEWDAVELPSQFFEHWCWDKTMLTHLTAPSDGSQSVLPMHLIDQLLKTKTFNAGIALLRQLEFTLFDLQIHSRLPGPNSEWIHQILKKIRQTTSLLPVTSYNRFQHSFSHVFAGGYAAGYYSYLWAEVLSSDCYSRFEQEGLLNSLTGHDFLHEILEVGSSRSALENFKAFMKREVSMDAFLRHRGIVN
jgi:oligopeptidase A